MIKTDKPIVVEQTFDRPVEVVWQAITVLDKMKKWFFSNIPSFDPEVGFETRFVIQVEDRIFPHLWRLTEVVPMKKITYDWRYEGYSGSSVVVFELIEKGSRTTLRLTCTVVEDFQANVPEFTRNSCIEGWNYFITESLKEYLEES